MEEHKTGRSLTIPMCPVLFLCRGLLSGCLAITSVPLPSCCHPSSNKPVMATCLDIPTFTHGHWTGVWTHTFTVDCKPLWRNPTQPASARPTVRPCLPPEPYLRKFFICLGASSIGCVVTVQLPPSRTPPPSASPTPFLPIPPNTWPDMVAPATPPYFIPFHSLSILLSIHTPTCYHLPPAVFIYLISCRTFYARFNTARSAATALRQHSLPHLRARRAHTAALAARACAARRYAGGNNCRADLPAPHPACRLTPPHLLLLRALSLLLLPYLLCASCLFYVLRAGMRLTHHFCRTRRAARKRAAPPRTREAQTSPAGGRHLAPTARTPTAHTWSPCTLHTPPYLHAYHGSCPPVWCAVLLGSSGIHYYKCSILQCLFFYERTCTHIPHPTCLPCLHCTHFPAT